MSGSAKKNERLKPFAQSPAWVQWLLSPATLTVLAAVLGCAWMLAQHDAAATRSVEDLSWIKLSLQSWFMKAWAVKAAILALPAAAGFFMGWIAHKQSGSAAGSALAAVAVVSFLLWQFGEKRDHEAAVAVTRPAAPTPSPAASATETVRAQAVPEAKPEPAADGQAEQAQALKQLQEEAAVKAAAAEKATQAAQAAEAAKVRRQQAAPAPAAPQPAPVVPMLADRNQLFVQVDNSAPSTAGVMPTPRPVEAEKSQANPIPGCRWATPTNWVCDSRRP
ncbi:MAG TPA: hypothetical protein VLJ58_00940 [Ramlibacter sp.]|nr:hypothetical protein [Ramlibacter sp.]